MTTGKACIGSEFHAALVDAGLDPGPESLTADGATHRFCGPGDKPGRKNCWYILFAEGGGAFGSWRLGIEQSVSPSSDGKSGASDRQRIEDARRQVETERETLRAQAAAKALRLYKHATIVSSSSEHPYLVRKRIQQYGARRMKDVLLIPIYPVDSHESVNLQCITPDGDKRFLCGGRVVGCCFTVADSAQDRPGAICIVEGFATGASVYEATQIPTVVAFNAGNLRSVAEALRKRYSDMKLILCADDDSNTTGNPGVAKAAEAARAVNALLAVPSFPHGAAGTDFNDLATSVGLEAVRVQIGAARKPRAPEIPPNFKLTKETLYVLKQRRQKDDEVVTDKYPVCSRLDVVALTRDESGGRCW